MRIDELKERLHYCPDTGVFTWLKCKNPRFTGEMAGGVCGGGYVYIGFDDKNYKAHRLAWFYMTGIWPTIVDHINRDRKDNRWLNLRNVSHSVNSANKKCLDRALPRGVIFRKELKPPQYVVRLCGERVGRFFTVEEAETAYRKAYKNKIGVDQP